MKLLSSFLKEVKLATQSFYFLIEVAFAFILLFVLLFVIPENMTQTKDKEYLYLDAPTEAASAFYEVLEDVDGKPEQAELKSGKIVYDTELYESDDKMYYLFETKEDMIDYVESKGHYGGMITIDAETYEDTYDYYLQGFETERLKNLLKVIHVEDMYVLEDVYDNQEIRKLTTEVNVLSDRKNIMPAVLTFNGALMGLFILAAYMFVDKQQGVIKAYAVTPSSVAEYLLSKIMVVSLTSIITTLIIVAPILGTSVNYLWMLLFLIGGGLYASNLGLMLASYYETMEQSFGVLYTLMILHGLPLIAFYIPSWDPTWIKFIPSYYIIYSFKELTVQNGDIPFVLWSTLGLIGISLIMFLLTNRRVKRTLSV